MATQDETSRILGGIVCLAAVLALFLFLYGLSVESYWALALPVAAVVVFVLTLVFWIGWTIMTVRVGATPASEELAAPEATTATGGPGAATAPAGADTGAGDSSPEREE